MSGDRPGPDRAHAAVAKLRLFAPGPVLVPDLVREAAARAPLHHRTPEFQALLLQVRRDLARLAGVREEDAPLVLQGGGTSAFEAAFLTAVSAGTPVVAVHAGRFGERWADLARAHGHAVHDVSAPWGRTVPPEEIADAVAKVGPGAAVTLVHSDTSTGLLHDLGAQAAAVRRADPSARIVVDVVTSLGVCELRPQEWGVDAIAAGSQKGLLLPPGLGVVWLSERVLHDRPDASRSFAFDLRREHRSQAEGLTFSTPPVTLVAAAAAVLPQLLADGGPQRIFRARKRLNDALLAAGEAVGCRPFAEVPSPAVAALVLPDGVRAPELVREAARRGVRIAGGQGATSEFVVRPSLLGWADAFDAIGLAGTLEASLRTLGQAAPYGAATAAAARVLEADDR